MSNTLLHGVKQYCDIPPQQPPGELAGALCHVGGGGVCGELVPFISGGIQGNLERDSGEMDQQSDLVERLVHSSSPRSSPTSKEGEDRVRMYTVCGDLTMLLLQ